MTEQLKEESLPSEITDRTQWVKEFVDEFKIGEDLLGGTTHIFLFRVNISDLPQNEIDQYMSKVMDATDPDIEKMSAMAFYVPTRSEPTSLTIVDLRTMKYVRL